jgi:hypothetical protein
MPVVLVEVEPVAVEVDPVAVEVEPVAVLAPFVAAEVDPVAVDVEPVAVLVVADEPVVPPPPPPPQPMAITRLPTRARTIVALKREGLFLSWAIEVSCSTSGDILPRRR